jgi:hypothetical protein
MHEEVKLSDGLKSTIVVVGQALIRLLSDAVLAFAVLGTTFGMFWVIRLTFPQETFPQALVRIAEKVTSSAVIALFLALTSKNLWDALHNLWQSSDHSRDSEKEHSDG